ncbi:MAG: prepilin peptidase, partial [Arenicellales bacterium]
MEIFQLLESSPPFLVIVTGVLGLVVGSFLNVVIHRLPVMMNRAWTSECREHLGEVLPETGEQTRFNLLTPASRCPHCNHRISALENIPVISYLFLKGCCAKCGSAISPRYPLVELTTALLSIITALHFGYSLQMLMALGFTWALVPLFLIDFDHQFLPDSITLPLL